MKISLIQTHLHWENAKQNFLHFDKILEAVSADLIVLPEMFTSGFSMNAAKLAQQNTHTAEWMLSKSLEKQAAVIGSYVHGQNDHYFNRLGVALPDGSFFYYDKRHLFQMAGEDAVYQAGKDKLVFSWQGWKICPLICYDLRFPVWSRNCNQANREDYQYDMLVYVANWPEARIRAWDILLRARAIENLCYVAGVNRIGADDNGIQYCGHSAIIDPKGEELAFSKKDSEVIYSELNINALREYREKFPAHKDADYFVIENQSR